VKTGDEAVEKLEGASKGLTPELVKLFKARSSDYMSINERTGRPDEKATLFRFRFKHKVLAFINGGIQLPNFKDYYDHEDARVRILSRYFDKAMANALQLAKPPKAIVAEVNLPAIFLQCQRRLKPP
jgi:predicted patatin/cPLA2 family phospholipase